MDNHHHEGHEHHMPGGTWKDSCRHEKMHEGGKLTCELKDAHGQW